MSVYHKKIGERIELTVREPTVGPAVLEILDGYNLSCKVNRNFLSLEEMRDLRYLLDRGIAAAESYMEQTKNVFR